jgi:hypothetical protein
VKLKIEFIFNGAAYGRRSRLSTVRPRTRVAPPTTRNRGASRPAGSPWKPGARYGASAPGPGRRGWQSAQWP